jgi:hypothetical protein
LIPKYFNILRAMTYRARQPVGSGEERTPTSTIADVTLFKKQVAAEIDIRG